MSQPNEHADRTLNARPQKSDFDTKPPAGLVTARGKLTVKAVSQEPKKVACWTCGDARGSDDLPTMEREVVARGGRIACQKHPW